MEAAYLCLPSGSALALLHTHGKEVIPLAPEAKTREAIQELFDNGYFKFPLTPFWYGKEIWKVVKGTHCLWKGVDICRNGHGPTVAPMNDNPTGSHNK